MTTYPIYTTDATLSLHSVHERGITRIVARALVTYRELPNGNKIPTQFTITAAIPMTPYHAPEHAQDNNAAHTMLGHWATLDQCLMNAYDSDSSIVADVTSESDYLPANGAANRAKYMRDELRYDYDDCNDYNGTRKNPVRVTRVPNASK